jgi:uncharacterized protein
MPNRLAQETSPYLLQHAENPVDWYPWGEEAFDRARREDKPVLLSIGYSACHWCHVMEHECFENGAIAGLMNQNFINIKVDREERPDLDHIYMEAVQAMTGSGGWPLTVFLTPEKKPFYGGTYFPPEDRHNLPGFPRVLSSVVNTYCKRRSAIDNIVGDVDKFLSGEIQSLEKAKPLSESILKQAYYILERSFDTQNGGFNAAPKFPYPMTLEFLLRYYTRFKDNTALGMVSLTLEKMAKGGIYDQIGGGFHRYATDGEWLVPHFEKMLYDNALLGRTYLHAYLLNGNKFLATIVEDTLDYVLREMRSPEGGFYSTQDADSEGEEGRYYLWTPQEIASVVGNELAAQTEDYFGVNESGNFEGRNILHLKDLQADLQLIRKARQSLLAKREQRVKPTRDEKVLASWNGLMLVTLAEAASILGRDDYLFAAAANGSFLLDRMAYDGKLQHIYTDGIAKIDGFLEDYASVIEGLLALHQATLSGKWLKSAIALADTMVNQFYDSKTGLLYDTPPGQNDLIVRPRNNFDGAIPAGTSLATLMLLKMSLLTGNTKYYEIADQELRSISNIAGNAPLGYSEWLCALDFYLSVPEEIILIGNIDNPLARKMANVVYHKWQPNKVMAAFDPADSDSVPELPVFSGRGAASGQPAVYICRNYSCQVPITSIEELEKQLKA